MLAIITCARSNPCTPENAAAGEFYFPHEDPTKFVQCSEWGQCYIMDCGPGTEWNPDINVGVQVQVIAGGVGMLRG